MVTLPFVVFSDIALPVTTVKPPHYRRKYLITLIPTVVQNYHPDKTETIDLCNQHKAQRNSSFEVNDIDLHKKLPSNITISNIQPSPKMAARVFPPLKYRKEKLQNFQENPRSKF